MQCGAALLIVAEHFINSLRRLVAPTVVGALAIRIITIAISLMFLSPATLHAQNVHVLLAADTEAEDIGDGCAADIDNIYKVFIANTPDDRTTIKKLTNSDATKEGIESAIQAASERVGSSDAIVFYYSGHGAFDLKKKDQYLKLHDGRLLYRKELRRLLQQSKPRLTVVITDTCSGYEIGEADVPRRTEPAFRPNRFSTLFTSLFLEHSGVTDISSSKPGEPAFGIQDVGGVFTFPLCEFLSSDENTDKKLDWRAVQGAMLNDTRTFLLEQKPKGITSKSVVYKTQTPYSYSLAVRDICRIARLGVAVKDHRQGDIQGAIVAEVVAGSPASRVMLGAKPQKLEIGDVITEINGITVRNAIACEQAIDRSRNEMLQLRVINKQDGKKYELTAAALQE